MNLKLAHQAIELIKTAESESEVLNAVAVFDSVDWTDLDELKDEWNDYYGDAQKYLP